MTHPRLLLLDLDNTLIDRAALFRGWAADFLERHDLAADDVPWLEQQDGDGLVPKDLFFEAVRSRYLLDAANDSLQEDYYRRYPAFTVPPGSDTLTSLEALRERGWLLGIVTNGPPMQEEVVDNAGLRDLVDTVCVSATVGLRKPDPAIFHLAAARCGAQAPGNWMVGDSAGHDVAGAHAAQMESGWIARGRAWHPALKPPAIIAANVAQVARHLLALDA